MRTLKNTLAGSLALVATFVTVAAATPLRAEPIGVAVAYGDLDIRSEAGAAKLEARIRRAAYQVCGQAVSTLEAAHCRREAADSAKAKLMMASYRSDVKLAAR